MMKRLIRIISVGSLLAVVGILVSVGSVSAKSSLTQEEEAMYSQNNILFYEPCNTTSSGQPLGGDISIAGSTAEEKVWSG